MHETGLVAEIYRIARETVETHGGGRLETVRLAIGELSAVEPDLLRFAWEAITQGTSDEGARLDVDFRRARQTCASCGDVAERALGSWLRLCPRCGGLLDVSGGDELDVLQVAFAEEAASEGSPG